MKTSKEKNRKDGLKMETFKIMEMSHPHRIHGGDGGGWTLRKDKDKVDKKK